MDDLTQFNQALADLIFVGEKLNSELTRELDRADRLAKATQSLRDLNDIAEHVITQTLYRIGVWKDDREGLPEVEMPRVVTQAAPPPPPLKSERAVDKIFSGLQ